MTTVDNLRQVLDETERIAQAALDQNAEEETGWWWDSPESPREEHISHHNPHAVLRMVAAHRKILDLHEPSHHDLNSPDVYCRICNPRDLYEGSGPCDTVYILAEAYDVEA